MIGESFTITELIEGLVKWIVALALDVTSSAPLLIIFFICLVAVFIGLIMFMLVGKRLKWIANLF